MYAKIENGVVVQYPYSYEQLKATQPHVSWPSSMPIERLNEYGVFHVVAKGQPTFDALTQKVTEVDPVFNQIKGQWEQSFVVDILSAEESLQAKAKLQDAIVSKVQARLDAWANERNYDGVLSLCTYATDSNPKFAAEGQHGVTNRSATWATLYQIMAEVESGTRPVPAGYEDIEHDLPTLEWPV